MTESKLFEQKHYSAKFPSISYLLTTYFHEDMFDVLDWKGNKHGYQGIIRHFKTIETSAKTESVSKELTEFLKISKDWEDDKLWEVLKDDFGSLFHAPFFNMTYRQYLEGVLEILQESPEKTKSEFIPQLYPDAGWGDESWRDYVDEETKKTLDIK